ncbi:MAG: DUF456 domain-containing protein [Kiritimatiellae bacterium]|jgi:uncharacterized protein YqgC (DUF456 family)|nr:DUF456 domain-containing protein [Kiritimatiellia bacterium]
MENITPILIIIAAIVISLVGVIGCVLPVLPGPVISFGAVLLVKFATDIPVSNQFLLVTGIITALVTIIDTVLPIYMPKKFGSSTVGILGATLGLIIGLFFPPVGFIIGPFLGALLFEYIKKRNPADAFVAGIGSFFGFMMGTVIKITLSMAITAWLIFKTLIPAIVTL